MSEVKKPYCVPWEAGLASSTKGVCKRLARLIMSMDWEITSQIVQGGILADLIDMRRKLCDGLAADGWTWSYQGGNRLTVREPGHKKPFGQPKL